jgi:hypothetical protein
MAISVPSVYVSLETKPFGEEKALLNCPDKVLIIVIV